MLMYKLFFRVYERSVDLWGLVCKSDKRFCSADGKAKATIGGRIKNIFEEGNLMKFQLFGFTEQLPQMAKIIRVDNSACRKSWLWDRAAVQI